MASKSTVAIDISLRKKLKKISALLDITQNEVIERAIKLLERDILSKDQNLQKINITKIDSTENMIERLLDEASFEVEKSDSHHKEIQKKLQQGESTIDDIIISHWEFGLDIS